MLKGIGAYCFNESKNCCYHNPYTFLIIIRSFPISNGSIPICSLRILLKYGEDVDLSENEKTTHAYTVLREWPSAREQLRLGQLYASEHGINLGENLLANQQYHTLSVYNKLSTQTGTIWKIF